MRTVCLLTAGLGTRMGAYAPILNKTMLPVKNKAIISYIIEQFPEDTKFVVALGYKGEDVRSYLTLAHPRTNFAFVTVNNFSGPLSGPAYSLSCCRPYLPVSGFTLMTCDGMYENLNSIPTDANYISVSKVKLEDTPAYCNVTNNNGVIKFFDKQYCSSALACNGAYHIFDTQDFWSKLSGSELSSGYKDLTNKLVELPWIDLGTYEKYNAYLKQQDSFDFSKRGEFIWIVNGRVIKLFNDWKTTINRVKRGAGRSYFPKIDFVKNGIYSYKLVPGKTLYEKNNISIFKRLLNWLELRVWPEIASHSHLTKSHLMEFYKEKTLLRLAEFRKKYPDFNPELINGKPTKYSMEQALELLDWNTLTEFGLTHRTAFIHGDCQFDNIIYDGVSFTLIDWRQDFANETDFGDLYYDVAKLHAGMIMNFDMIKKNLFKYEELPNGIFFEFTQRSNHDKMIKLLNSKFQDSLTIQIIVSLIFLNMAGLHESPFDKLLFCLALERLNLQV